MRQDKRLVEVAPGFPLPKTLCYQAPENLRNTLEISKRVLVLLGQRMITGFVLEEVRGANLSP